MVNIIKIFRPVYRRERKPSRLVRVWCLLIIGLFYLAAATNTANAATYYLDAANGDDTNPGTSGAPWQTLDRAYTWYSGAGSKVQEGDIVLFRDGNYGDYLETTGAGGGSARLVYRTNWITYKADTGHTPNLTNIYIYNKDKWGGAGDGSSYLIFDGFNLDEGVGVSNTSYVQIRNCTITLLGSYVVSPWNGPYAPYIYYGSGVGISNAHYITIENNDISYARNGIALSGSSADTNNINIIGNTIHRMAEDGIQFICSNLLIEGNHVSDIRSCRTIVNIWGTVTGKFIEGETAVQPGSGEEAIVDTPPNGLGTSDLKVMQLTSSKFTSGGGTITGQSSGATVTNITKVDGTHTDAIQIHGGSVDGITITSNILLRTGGQVLKISTAGSGASSGIDNIVIENNLIWGGKPIIGRKLDPTEGPMNVISLNNNTFCSIGVWGEDSISNNDLNITDMFNNIFACNQPFKPTNHGNNIFRYVPTGFTTNPTELVYYPVENLFVDAANGDFGLAQGSVAIDFGNATYAPTTDILGNPRGANPDAGCYESNTSDPNNPTPVLQAIGDKLVDENVALIFDVNATDPNGEPITYSAQGLPSGATLDPLTGEFDWTPSYNQAGSYQVTFRASDGNSWDSESITITVNNINRPPVIGAITDQSVNENDLLSLSVNASDPDGQALTYSVGGLPAGAVFVSQTLTWTPGYDQAGTFPVTFTADDGQAQDSEAITITVINVNRAPVFTAINNQSVWADDPLTFTIDATDPDGDAVTYSAGALPTDATFTGQDFNWTPSHGQMGSYNVTFIASDGQLQDSQMVTITVDVDSLAPAVTNSLPTAGSIQAPLNNLINLNITDAGKGIDADSVTIKVNNNTVYTGDTNHYSSPDGECRRVGNKADYRFVYQSNEEFDYDQTVSITVNATDLAGNVMSENSYSFVTEMRSFGQNMMVNSGSVNLNSGRPVTVRDSSGNIWAAWHAGPIDNRDIYIGKLAAGEENFGGTVQLADNTTDQCNPAVALDSSDKLYVVWQDNREGDWDIYVSTSVDGISWTTETRVNDPNDGDQVNPAIVIDGQSANQAYVVWQDDRTGSQDICVATSSDGFVTTTVSQITSHISDQVEPAVAADSDNTIYVVWTDGRNGSNDIYGAASNNGPWNNVPIVTEDDGQSSPAIATEAVGSILHLVWVDDRLGDDDIFYDKTIGGLSPLTGRSIIDDTTGADQISPVIITTSYTGDLKVFACWRDERNADADLYCVEIGSGNETNVFVGDDDTNSDQSEPAIGIDIDGYPYLVWTNERTDIYYAGSTFVEPVALASTNVSVSSTATVGTVWNAVNSLDDVSAEVPQGAYLCDVKITISKIKNPPKSNLELDLFSGTYEFSPSGMEFIEPVTITIPYEVNGSENVLYTAYWYNPLTNTLSQQGITDVETIVISSTLHAVRFKTTHFSAFILGGSVAAALGGGGGGCSVSAGSEGNIVEFVLPYIGLVVVMAMLKVRDTRYRKARNT